MTFLYTVRLFSRHRDYECPEIDSNLCANSHMKDRISWDWQQRQGEAVQQSHAGGQGQQIPLQSHGSLRQEVPKDKQRGIGTVYK